MTTSYQQQEDQRLHALDAVRAFALLTGIVLHATMSFFSFLPAPDRSQSTTLAVLFYVIHMFRMSTFFLIAGFFASMMIKKRGLRSFAWDRTRRILVPLVVGWISIAPLVFGTVIWGVNKTYQGQPPAELIKPVQGFPLVHLWFLYYLCLFYACALAVHCVHNMVPNDRFAPHSLIDKFMDAGLRWGVAPLFFGAPLITVLFFSDSWPVWSGIPTPDFGFSPRLSAVVGFGIPFAIGWRIQRNRHVFAILIQQGVTNLVVATALTVICLGIVGPVPNEVDATYLPGGVAIRLLYAASYVMAIWFWSFAVIGLALRHMSGFSAARRYLADSSYWLYLLHLPIVFALQVLLIDVGLHWTVKFPLILLISMAMLLASYHYLVRPTILGKILNGRRYPTSPASTTTIAN